MLTYTFSRRFKVLMLLLLAGCEALFPAYSNPRTDVLVEAVAANNDGVVGDYARADREERLTMGHTDGVAVALHVIERRDPREVWEALVGIAQALEERGDRAGAEVMLEIALEGILRPHMAAGCPSGLTGVQCRREEYPVREFDREAALRGIAAAAEALGNQPLAQRALAAAQPDEGSGVPEDRLAPILLGADAPEALEEMLGPAVRLAQTGDAAGGARLARDALLGIRAVTDEGVQGLGLLMVARLFVAVGAGDEAVALAKEAGALRLGLRTREPVRRWRMLVLEALVARWAGEMEEGERLIWLAVGLGEKLPELDPQNARQLARQEQRWAVREMSAAGWHRPAMATHQQIPSPGWDWDMGDVVESSLAMVEIALAVGRDPDLGEPERRARFREILGEGRGSVPGYLHSRWREDAKRDPFAAAMYAATARSVASSRGYAYAMVLNAAHKAGRDDIVAAVVEELDAMGIAWEMEGWIPGTLTEMGQAALRLPGNLRDQALELMERQVAKTRTIPQVKVRLGNLWYLAERYEEAGLADQAQELWDEVTGMALAAGPSTRDELLSYAVRSHALRNEIARGEELAEMIQAEKWQAKAGKEVSLARARNGDWDAAWDQLASLATPKLRMELLEGVALLLGEAGDTPAARTALAKMEAVLEGEEEARFMGFEARLALARVHLAAGNRERAGHHYELASLAYDLHPAAPGINPDHKAVEALPLADMARELGRGEESRAHFAVASTVSRPFLARMMMDYGMWNDALGVAREIGAKTSIEYSTLSGRDEMLGLLADLASKIGLDQNLDTAEMEAILAQILDAVG